MKKSRVLLSLIVLFWNCSLVLAQQKGIGASVIFNNFSRELVTGVDKSNPRSQSLIHTNLWQQRYNICYFKSLKESKRTWLFFANAGYSKNFNDNGTKAYVAKDTTFLSLFNATITRSTIELGATYRKELYQNDNKKLRLGLGYTGTIMRWNKDVTPNTSEGFRYILSKTGVDLRFEPYLSYEITPTLYFDLSIFRLLGMTTTIAKSVHYNPAIPINQQTSLYIDFDGQFVSFRNIGIQTGLRYALHTEKEKKKRKK